MYNKHMSTPKKNISKKKYVKVKDRRQGLATSDRPKTTTKKNSNQWISDPRQDAFVNFWLTPGSDTFGNAYQSAIKAGYSTYHAKNITTNALSLEWIKEAKGRLAKFTPEHIVKKLEALTNASKDSDKIRALELLARVNGLFIDRSVQHIDVQFTNAVPRPNTPSNAHTSPTIDNSTNNEVIDL